MHRALGHATGIKETLMAEQADIKEAHHIGEQMPGVLQVPLEWRGSRR